MNKEEFLNEMLKEVKDLKDLAKGELPEVAREYIASNKVQCFLKLGLSMVLILIAIAAGYYCLFGVAPESYRFDSNDDRVIFAALVATLYGALGVIMGSVTTFELIELFMEPRRMAIRAITSLF